MEDFFDLYERYVSNTEVPPLFHRWCAVMGVAASLGKRVWFERGHFNVSPNLYVMLIGSPGTGKGTAMGILQTLMLESGYTTFAADKSSKEKFLMDLQEGFSFDAGAIDADPRKVLDLAAFLGENELNKPAEVFILAEEFNDFIGLNNYDFIALLTKLWSYQGVYRNRLKNSKSVSIIDPCVNLLGGNTSAGFAMAFPPEIIGQGFLARLLPVYGEPTGRKISFPQRPSATIRGDLAGMLQRIRLELSGGATISEEARELLDRIHQEWKPLNDFRFQHYAARRFNQLIKLCLVFAAGRFSKEISVGDIKRANTLLSHTEELMPKAIGEFGKAKNSDVTSKIMEALYTTSKPLTTQDLWKLCISDLNSQTELANILTGLVAAEKVQMVKNAGWLPRIKATKAKGDFVDEDMQKRLRDGLNS